MADGHDEGLAQWGQVRTALFRAFVIFTLAAIAPLEPVTNPVIPWVGKVILGIEREIPMGMTGSGDTTAEYIRLFLHGVLTLVGTIVWTLIAGTRARYGKGLHWFALAVRVSLGAVMVSYGLSKVFDGQFLTPGPGRLITTYGESSPMGLLWTFMGHSKAYCVFTGMAEVLGGLLVLSRRTQTLGALVVIGVMANVVMLNFCYDVPVKLFSMRLLVMALFLAGLDYRRLLDVFVRQRATQARPLPRLYSRPRAHKAGQVAKILYAAFLLVGTSIGFFVSRPTQPEVTSVLGGLYEVESFERDGTEVPPLLTDETRWRRLVIGRWGRGVVQHMNDKRKGYAAEIDPDTSTLTLTDQGDSGEEETVVYELTYVQQEREDETILILEDDELSITLRKIDPNSFQLRSRGFHWVQEQPINR